MKILLNTCLLFLSLNLINKVSAVGGGLAQIPYLIEIINENLRRYEQLKRMMALSERNQDYLRLLNSGLENSIGLLNSLPVRDENILEDLHTFSRSYKSVSHIYGKVPKSRESLPQLLHDQTVAESIKMANDFKRYSKEQEKNSTLMTLQGRRASPKGAQRMQVEISAQILKSLSQLIRLNTQILKLQLEHLGLENKRDKDSIAGYQKWNRQLILGFKNLQIPTNLSRYSF